MAQERIQPDKIAEFRDKVDKRAYSKWKARGRIHGLDLQDHLEAEKEIIREEVIREAPHHYGMSLETLGQDLELSSKTETDLERPNGRNFVNSSSQYFLKRERDLPLGDQQKPERILPSTPAAKPEPAPAAPAITAPLELDPEEQEQLKPVRVRSRSNRIRVQSNYGYYDEKGEYKTSEETRFLEPLLQDQEEISKDAPVNSRIEELMRENEALRRKNSELEERIAKLEKTNRDAELPKPAAPKLAEEPKPQAPETPKPIGEEKKPEEDKAPKAEEPDKPANGEKQRQEEETRKKAQEDEQKKLDDAYKKGVEDGKKVGKEELWTEIKRPKSIMEKIKTLFRRHPKEPKTDAEKVEKYKRDIYRTVVLGGVASALTTLSGVGIAQYFFGHFLIPLVNKIPELNGNRVNFK